MRYLSRHVSYILFSHPVYTHKYYDIVIKIFVIHITRDSPQVEIRENENATKKSEIFVIHSSFQTCRFKQFCDEIG